MSRTTHHLALSVDVDRYSDATLAREFDRVLVRAGRHVPWTELRALCAEYRAKGYAVFPPCDRTGPKGDCLGHPVEDEQIHVGPPTAPTCEPCSWPTEGLAKRLVDEMRERHGKGGLNVCRDCVMRAHREQAERIAAFNAKREEKRHG